MSIWEQLFWIGVGSLLPDAFRGARAWWIDAKARRTSTPTRPEGEKQP